MNKKTVPIWFFFSIQVPIEFPRIVFPTPILPMGVHINFVRKVPSSMIAQKIGHLCRGRRIHTSGHCDLGIVSNLEAPSDFTWVLADAASAVCPSQSGNLAITSITFAAAIWTADQRCSVKTAEAPESSITMSLRSTTLHLNLFDFGSSSAFLRWHMSISVAKWTFFLSLCA